MDLLLDGKLITDKQKLFEILKQQINSTEFYGDNLDALWDVLSYMDKKINIEITNYENLEKNLKEYAVSLIELFKELKNTNKLIDLVIN